MALTSDNRVEITIDGQAYRVESGQNLLQACLGLGLELPYFCWHPALGSVGACRQCALIQYQDESDTRGRLVMGCMTPVSDGQRLSLQAEQAVDFRSAIIETLMTNHPHDCPVCEEGGECHLQDMTVMSGHTRRRYSGRKRTFNNQDLGPFVGHEMNRCITCYRCVRYYRDYAGGDDLHALASRNRTYFGRFEDGPLESEFSGNLVEVCPTGVFTDKPLSRSYTRKWDLQSAPSVCVHCSLGCNTSPGERYGRLKRIQNRYNHQVNGYFLCDRGRFGYDFVNHPQRPRTPYRVEGGERRPLEPELAAQTLGKLLQDDNLCWIGIGSARATLESNLALQRLVGAERFFSGLSDTEEQLDQALLKLLRSGHGEPASMGQVEDADAILILGEDITQSAPRLALSVRQAARSRHRAKADSINVPPWQAQAVQIAGQDSLNPLYLTSTTSTRLDNLAQGHYRGSPLEQARLGFAVAHRISASAPEVTGLTQAQAALADTIATTLLEAQQPLVITGSGSQCPELIDAAEQILAALCEAQRRDRRPWVCTVFKQCNSLGLALLNHRGQENSLNDAFDIVTANRANGGKPIAAIILENDLYRGMAETEVEGFLDGLCERVLIDYLPGRTLERATLVLPAATFAEAQGVLINHEARAQLLFPVYPAPPGIQAGWQWLHQAAAVARPHMADFASQPRALQSCIEADPLLGALTTLMAELQPPESAAKIPRMSHRASGRTAMYAHLDVHEPRQPQDPQSPLGYSMEGVPSTAMTGRQPAGGLMPASWYPGWNSNQSVHKFQQPLSGPLSGPEGGVRLQLRSAPDPVVDWHTPPKKPRGHSDRILLITQPQIFGSDPMSALSAPVAERIQSPYVSLHPDDAKTFQIDAGDRVQVAIDHRHVQLPVRIDPEQAPRVAMVADHHPLLGNLHGAWVSIRSLGPNPVITSDRRAAHD